MLKHLSLLGCCSVLVLLSVLGCSDQAKDDYSSAGSDVKSAAQKTGKAISEDTQQAAEKIQDKTKDIGPDVSKASDNAKAAMGNDKMSLAVTNAIGQRKDLTVNDLKVDTNANTITLSGSVSSEDQRHIAEHVATAIGGPGFIVDDRLTIK